MIYIISNNYNKYDISLPFVNFLLYNLILAVSPSRITLAGGSSINLTCYLNEGVGEQYTSSDVIWKQNKTVIPDANITVINNVTSQYTLVASFNNISLLHLITCGVSPQYRDTSLVYVNGRFKILF